jgi:tRNA uridine 5-carbamoylmethylation protein Kti12
MKVIIMRGGPGSGKSTLARKLASELEAQGYKARCFSADFYFEKAGVYQFDRNLLGKAHAACLKGFAQDLVFCYQWPNKDVLIVDNTNTTEAEVAPYARLAQAFGAELEIVTADCDQATAFARQTHGVPEKNHKSMAERMQRSRLPKEWPQRSVKTS